jgi:hypothetical protein
LGKRKSRRENVSQKKVARQIKNLPDRLKVRKLKNFFHRIIPLQNFKKAIIEQTRKYKIILH